MVLAVSRCKVKKSRQSGTRANAMHFTVKCLYCSNNSGMNKK